MLPVSYACQGRLRPSTGIQSISHTASARLSTFDRRYCSNKSHKRISSIISFLHDRIAHPSHPGPSNHRHVTHHQRRYHHGSVGFGDRLEGGETASEASTATLSKDEAFLTFLSRLGYQFPAIFIFLNHLIIFCFNHELARTCEFLRSLQHLSFVRQSNARQHRHRYESIIIYNRTSQFNKTNLLRSSSLHTPPSLRSLSLRILPFPRPRIRSSYAHVFH